MSDRLAPSTTPDTKFFWDALKEGKLLIQRCAGCATLRHPPRPMCPRCNSLTWDTIESSGRGEVYSFVLPRHPPWPWFEGTHIVALIELEEGTRIVSNLCDVDPNDATIGMPVQAMRGRIWQNSLVQCTPWRSVEMFEHKLTASIDGVPSIWHDERSWCCSSTVPSGVPAPSRAMWASATGCAR